MDLEQEQCCDRSCEIDSNREKLSVRDKERRYNRDRSNRPRSENLFDDDDDGRYTKQRKSHREEMDQEDRRVSYDKRACSRESRDFRSTKDSHRDREDSRNVSTTISRKRDIRDSRKDQIDSKDVKEKPRSSSRDVKSMKSRDRRDCKDEDDKDYAESRYMNEENYKNQTPNHTIMVRYLARNIRESDIRQDILQCGLVPKDVRLIRKKDTGTSRGFAFVEFNTVQEALRWMEMKQGFLVFQDRCRAEMHFSIPKEFPILKDVKVDWHCVLCGSHNFKRRDNCFKCHGSRQVSEEGGEGSEEVSPNPTTTVLLRNLDALSTADSVLRALKQHHLSDLPIRSIRIGQDALTNTSRGLCYIELNNVLDSVFLHDTLTANPLVVDGRPASVSYCKLHIFNANSTSNSETENSSMNHQYGADDIPRLAEYCASLYASSPQEHTAYVQYYKQYYENQLGRGGIITIPSKTQADSVNAAAALAQSAIQQVQAAKEIKKHRNARQQQKDAGIMSYQMAQLKNHATQAAAATMYHSNPTPMASSSATYLPYVVTPSKGGTALPKYPVPDVSTYQYDENSGYYYDAQTGLYYDATSQYYFNAQTQQFLYWDAEKQTYVPALHGAGDETTARKDDGKKEKDNDKQDKVKVAKKIAKDMERWAKTLNQKKENARQNIVMPSTSSVPDKSLGAADAGYAILERKEFQLQDISSGPSCEEDEEKQSHLTQVTNASVTRLVAAYGSGNESDEETEDVFYGEKQHVNWTRLICLLCTRQFPSKESLSRHLQLSDLHKQNLEQWYRAQDLHPLDSQQQNNKYRDRARERRLKSSEPV